MVRRLQLLRQSAASSSNLQVVSHLAKTLALHGDLQGAQLFQRKDGSLLPREWKVGRRLHQSLQGKVEELVRQARPSGPLYLFSKADEGLTKPEPELQTFR